MVAVEVVTVPKKGSACPPHLLLEFSFNNIYFHVSIYIDLSFCLRVIKYSSV